MYLCRKFVDFKNKIKCFYLKRQRVIQFMKKIVEYRKLLNVDKTAELKDLKTIYRNAMKEAHPDKFQGDEAGLKEAEENSKKIIEAYHFLVSINPETTKQLLPEYTETISTATISDYKFVDGRLIINFSNGSVYEYISVPKATYVKMVNADSPGRFAKRHILNSFTWRKTINQD
jgi:curved DNA-binding protein CbpA